MTRYITMVIAGVVGLCTLYSYTQHKILLVVFMTSPMVTHGKSPSAGVVESAAQTE